MTAILNFAIRFVSFLGVSIVLWALILNLSNSQVNGSPAIYLALLTLIIMMFFLLPKNVYIKIYKKTLILFKEPKTQLLAILFVLSLSLLLRFSFLGFDYNPTSDPRTFFNKAIELYTNGTLSEGSVEYVSRFPYVHAYDTLLGLSMEIFGPSLVAVVALNTALDLTTAAVIYVLIRKMTKSHAAGLIGFLLWIVSPFNIIFSVISLPVVVVNTFISVSILLVYLLSKSLADIKLSIVLSVATGVSLGLANSFRPIMIIFIIALSLYIALILMRKFDIKTATSSAVSISVLVATFSLVNIGFLGLVESRAHQPVPPNAGGWSIFVGSNTKYQGTWNGEDKIRQDEVFAEADTHSEAHQKLKEEGIERYSNLLFKDLIKLMLEKLSILVGIHNTSVYNLSSYSELWSNIRFRNVVHFVGWMYIVSLLGLALRYLIENHKTNKPNLNTTTYLTMVMTGLFLSHMLVEVSNRYFTSFYVILTVFAALALHRIILKCNKAVKSSKVPSKPNTVLPVDYDII